MLKPTIFIVDDNEVISEALGSLLKMALDLPVTIYHDARIFLTHYTPDLYGCLLVDILMPGMSGLELLEELKQRRSLMPVIVLTGHGDIALAVKTMQAGAKDFIAKPFNSQQLIEKVRSVLTVYEEQHNKQQHIFDVYNTLTPRERHIMQLITAGKLNKQIAHELKISLKTVEQHRFNIMHKLNIRTVAELIKIQHIMIESS